MNKTCGSSDRRLSCSLILEQRTRKARSSTTVRLWSATVPPSTTKAVFKFIYVLPGSYRPLSSGISLNLIKTFLPWHVQDTSVFWELPAGTTL